MNNIFDGNDSYAIYQPDGSSIVSSISNNLFNNNIGGLMWWTGQIVSSASKGSPILNNFGFASDNIEGDPLFVDRDGYNFHVLVTSPAIDTGKVQSFGQIDIDGDARPYDVPYHPFTQVKGPPVQAVDIGFDEAVITSTTDTDEDGCTDYDELAAGTDPLNENDCPSLEGEGEGVFEGEGEGVFEGEGEGLFEGEGEGECPPHKHPWFCGPAQTPGSTSGNALILLTALAGLLLYRARKTA